MKTGRALAVGVIALVLFLAIIGWRLSDSSNTPERPFETRTKPIEGAPMCPWREPETDLQKFFPTPARYEKETRILSGQRPELTRRLGRTPDVEENALYLFRVIHDQKPAGLIVTRRVKGEYGAIEIVLAVSETGQVRGLRLQRLREPATIAAALGHPAWLESFQGRTVRDAWKLGADVPEVAPEARTSALAIVEAVRSLLILLDTATGPGVVARPHH